MTVAQRDLELNDDYNYSYTAEDYSGKEDKEKDWRDDAFYTPHGCYVAINPNGVPAVVPDPNKEED